jgi:hypothetical protein
MKVLMGRQPCGKRRLDPHIEWATNFSCRIINVITYEHYQHRQSEESVK